MEEVTTSGIEKLAAALAKAQAKFKNPEKNRTVTVRHKAEKGGGSHTFSYATLDVIMDAVRGPLSENGLAVSQLVIMRDGVPPILVTKLMHESGQCIESVYRLRDDLGIQEMGSMIMYARRYTICPMLGICGQTDTDGEEAAIAEEQAEESRKAAAAELLKGKAAAGELTDANTGKKLKPDDITDKGEVKPIPETKPAPAADIPMGGLNSKLAAKLTESGITVAQYTEYAVSKGHFPAGMDLSKLKPDYVDAVLANWPKVVAAIKK